MNSLGSACEVISQVIPAGIPTISDTRNSVSHITVPYKSDDALQVPNLPCLYGGEEETWKPSRALVLITCFTLFITKSMLQARHVLCRCEKFERFVAMFGNPKVTSVPFTSTGQIWTGKNSCKLLNPGLHPNKSDYETFMILDSADS